MCPRTGIVIMTSYKTCAVSMCGSTTVKYPDKLFIHVPKSPKRRKLWLQLARRDPNLLSHKSPIYFCQDHFDLPNDMENYIQYSVMGSVGKIRMKPDCLPSKLECQTEGIRPEETVTLGAKERVSQLSTEYSVQLMKHNSRYYNPDAERGQPTPVKRAALGDAPRASQLQQLLGSPTRPRGTRLTCAPLKVTSGSSPRFQDRGPPQQTRVLIAETRREAGEVPPSGDDAPSCDKEPEQINDSLPPEGLVPLSVHPVPVSDAPDPLSDVPVKREEEEGAADGTGGEGTWAVKEEGRTPPWRPEAVGDEPRVVQPPVDYLFQTSKQEQKIQNLARQREQLRLQVHKMREMIRRRDAKILKLQLRLGGLLSARTTHAERRVKEAGDTCAGADTDQIHSVNVDGRKKKANRVLYVVKGADRPKSAQNTSHIRQTSVQGDVDNLQQSLIRILDTTEMRQKTLLAVKNTSETTETVIPNSVSVKQKLDIRKTPLLDIEPKKPSTGTKRKLVVVKTKSNDTQIGRKRKLDIRQNSSVVIHPKLDIRQKVSSDIPRKSVGLQCPSDIRQNRLVIQIDGMHSTVLQPKLVRLENNNMDQG